MTVRDTPPFSLYFSEWLGLHGRLAIWPDRTAARGRDGRGRAVLVFPGFMAHDVLTHRLRGTLALAGYRPFGWAEGVNLGADVRIFDRLSARLDQVVAAASAPVSLVGWSLGGIFARELAKRRPQTIDRVITLGSPFSGDPRTNRLWRAYELITGYPIDRPPFEADIAAKPPVPTFALWSRRDGVVAPSCARGQPGERDAAIEVDCRHQGFVVERAALRAVLDALER